MLLEILSSNCSFEGIECFAGFDARILVNYGIECSVKQQLSRILCHFVANQQNVPSKVHFFERLSDTGIAGANIINCGKIAMFGQ